MNEFLIKLIVNGGKGSGNFTPGQGRGIGKPSNSATISKKASSLKAESKTIHDDLDSRLEKSIKNNESFKPYQNTYYDLMSEARVFRRKFKYWESQKEDKRRDLQFLEKKFNSFKDFVKINEDILNTYRAKDKLNDFLTNEAYKLDEKTSERKQNSLENDIYSLMKKAKDSSTKHDSKYEFYKTSYKIDELEKDINSFMEDVNDLEIG